jgi:TPR repeat protein
MIPILFLPAAALVCQVEQKQTPRQLYDLLLWNKDSKKSTFSAWSSSIGTSSSKEWDDRLKELYKEGDEYRAQLQRLADSGNIEAQYLLGIYRFNEVDSSTSEAIAQSWLSDAVKYLRMAVASDYAPAVEALAHMSAVGKGLPKSDLVAIEWYAKAGTTYLKQGDRDNALICLEKAKKLDENNPATKALVDKLFPKPKSKK